MESYDQPRSAPPQKVSTQACLECRMVKMKCNMQPGATRCDRCLRKSMECTFQKHRRGRKPGTRLNRPGRLVDSNASASGMPAPKTAMDMDPAAPDEESKHVPMNGSVDGSASEPSPTSLPAKQHSAFEKPADYKTEGRSRPVWEVSDNLQPSGLLNKDAMSGKFSLQHILSSSTDPQQPPAPTTDYKPSKELSLDDPLRLEGLNYPIANSLFDNFMRYQNPYLCQFDPKLHTFEYVQPRSSFLLSAILTAASKAFHPPLHPPLLAHTESLLAQSFSKGVKSVETVQAILLMTYWKEPDDTRSWLSVGYAIRMCIELGWHNIEPFYAQQNKGKTELERREQRNVERTWLVLVSLQLGKPWMIDEFDFICTSKDWYKDDYANFGCDVVLCSFVRLRLIGCEAIDLLSPNRQTRHLDMQQELDTLIRLLMGDIKRWEIDWLPIADSGRLELCQSFLMRFYGVHLRLLLNSFPLQHLLKRSQPAKPISKRVVWTCFSAAVDMMRLLADDLGPSQLLYLAQDSILVMTAYAAVFLVKLLSSVPPELLRELEPLAIQAISNAAQAFAVQRAAPKSGCALQAKFLSNVVKLYHTTKLPSTAARPVRSDVEWNATAATAPPNTLGAMNSAAAGLRRPVVTNYSAATPRAGGYAEMASPAAFGMESSLGTCDLTFEDHEMWDNIFISAGFDVHNGVFQANMDDIIV